MSSLGASGWIDKRSLTDIAKLLSVTTDLTWPHGSIDLTGKLNLTIFLTSKCFLSRNNYNQKGHQTMKLKSFPIKKAIRREQARLMLETLQLNRSRCTHQKQFHFLFTKIQFIADAEEERGEYKSRGVRTDDGEEKNLLQSTHRTLERQYIVFNLELQYFFKRFLWWLLLIMCPQQIHDWYNLSQSLLFLYPFCSSAALPNTCTHTMMFDMRDYIWRNWTITKMLSTVVFVDLAKALISNSLQNFIIDLFIDVLSQIS